MGWFSKPKGSSGKAHRTSKHKSLESQIKSLGVSVPVNASEDKLKGILNRAKKKKGK